jgi:hypothetical protein
MLDFVELKQYDSFVVDPSEDRAFCMRARRRVPASKRFYDTLLVEVMKMGSMKSGVKSFSVVGLFLALAASQAIGATSVYVNPNWATGDLYRYDHTGATLTWTASTTDNLSESIGLACDPELGRLLRANEFSSVVCWLE